MSYGVFVNVWWEHRTLVVVNVVNPLVVDFWVSQFINPFDVVGGLLFLLLLVEMAGSGVVSELA